MHKVVHVKKGVVVRGWAMWVVLFEVELQSRDNCGCAVVGDERLERCAGGAWLDWELLRARHVRVNELAKPRNVLSVHAVFVLCLLFICVFLWSFCVSILALELTSYP